MGKVVVARRYPLRKRKTRLEKKMKKDNRRKKQALAECEYKQRRKEQLEKRKEQLEKRKKEELVKHRFEKAYWDRVWESDGFDIDGLRSPSWSGMKAFKCEKPDDCPLLVRLYAKMGLHRYNMLQGTNLQLHRIERYNRQVTWICRPYWICRPSSYYITLVAEDQATCSLVPFQTSSHESLKHRLNVGFYVARPQNTGTIGKLWDDETAPKFYNISVPQWPTENDKKHFYLVEESELKENDWIRLYLELGFVTTNPRIPNPELSDLKIVEVMVETEKNLQQPNERLKGFIDATFYITYDQDLGEGRVCKRRAIIRRSVDLRTERMHLMGDYHLESKT